MSEEYAGLIKVNQIFLLEKSGFRFCFHTASFSDFSREFRMDVLKHGDKVLFRNAVHKIMLTCLRNNGIIFYYHSIVVLLKEGPKYFGEQVRILIAVVQS